MESKVLGFESYEEGGSDGRTEEERLLDMGNINVQVKQSVKARKRRSDDEMGIKNRTRGGDKVKLEMGV